MSYEYRIVHRHGSAIGYPGYTSRTFETRADAEEKLESKQRELAWWPTGPYEISFCSECDTWTLTLQRRRVDPWSDIDTEEVSA